MNQLTKPLTKDEVESLLTEDGWLKVVVVVDLSDIVHNDIEGLKHLCEELVLDNIAALSLSNTSYKVVGHIAADVAFEVVGGKVLLEVLTEVVDTDPAE